MLEIPKWSRPLSKILNTDLDLPAEMALEVNRILRPVVIFQEHPDLAVNVLGGVFVPPHERLMLQVCHRGALSNIFIGSRGTSKTATVAAMYVPYKNLFYPKRQAILLSASGFRGGQMVMNDIEKFVNGAWVDQEADLPFYRASITSGENDRCVHRAQNYWQINFTSFSGYTTVPTNDPEKLRGLRGTELVVDEANFTDFELMGKVADSFLNVLQDFRFGGEEARANIVYYTTTIDYAWRDFQKTALSAYESLRRELEALTAAQRGDWEAYEKLESRGLHRSSYVCFDYTDTIIRRFITTRSGKKYEVHWPDKARRWRLDKKGVPFTVRGADGRMVRDGLPVEVISTYPLNRSEMEGKLLTGETSEPIWLAEQRNVLDTSTGDVYPHAIVDIAVCKGNRSIIAYADCGDDWKKRYRQDERPFVGPVLYTCTDPCVLGVDYAPGSRDFSAFVVIRIGPLSEGTFDPFTGLGMTDWSNVIWAEQHRSLSGEDVAAHIRHLAERYNLVYFDDPYQDDPWRLCRAIGLDLRGGGNTVRDALVYLNRESVEPGEYRIYDPLDPDERMRVFRTMTDVEAKPMLDTILPTSQFNDKMVEFTVGQLTTRQLFLPADVPPSFRPNDSKLDIGYTGARILEYQLRALQQQPTGSGYRKFFMKGDDELPTNKKDMWAAFLYGAKQLRAHLIRYRSLQDVVPPMAAAITSLGGRRHGNRSPGTTRW